MTPDEEAAYEQGKKAAALSLLRHALGEVCGSETDDPLAVVARLEIERAETVAILREVCADYGDNNWPDDLHLADVVEKHLERPLRDGAAHSSKRCPSCGSRDVTEATEDEEVTYGVVEPVKLTAKVVVITCHACGEAWTDERGEDSRSDAVTHYLQRRVTELEEANTRVRVTLSKLTEDAAKECGRLREELEDSEAVSECRRAIGEAVMKRFGVLSDTGEFLGVPELDKKVSRCGDTTTAATTSLLPQRRR
jgi:hypothetical protein